MSLAEKWKKFYPDEKYYRVYEFVPPINTENFISRIPGISTMKMTIDLLANLDKGLNVLELTLGLRNFYPDITPNDVLSILESLAARKYVRIAYVKKDIGETRSITKYIECPLCKRRIEIQINLDKLDFSTGLASISVVHGKPAHLLVVYIDRNGKIRGVEVHKDIVMLEE